ncbi:hypothetical protein DW091_19500 [Eubacterium sp. AM05-23]|uniref:FIVAR domain-containing protein n=1 Tax=Eubacterium TaxID=1730 RepID=UPI000E4A2029|nr:MULTISPECIES: FIVAR domain-containing protein [Eubacterium]RHO53474.1 hypothetical protein DW091_19500 [Eubacterium sp. AM05-23]
MIQQTKHYLQRCLVLLLVVTVGLASVFSNSALATGNDNQEAITTSNTFDETKDKETILISTAEDFIALRNYVASGEIQDDQSKGVAGGKARSAKLMADIDLSDIDFTETMTPSSSWDVSFDGGGHTITGFSGNTYGLFGQSLAVGYNYNSDGTKEKVKTTITNLHVDGNIDTGSEKLTEESTYNYGLFANNLIGGVMDLAYCEISNCVVTGNINIEIPSDRTIGVNVGGMFYTGPGTNANSKVPIKNCLVDVDIAVINHSEAPVAIYGVARSAAMDHCISLSSVNISGEGSSNILAYGMCTAPKYNKLSPQAFFNKDATNADSWSDDLSYYDNGKTSEELKKATTYDESWDTNVWTITDGKYPVLKTFGAESTPDISELESVLKEAKAITNDDKRYTDSSYQTLQNAIKTVEDAISNLSTADLLLKDFVLTQTSLLKNATNNLIAQGPWAEAVENLDAALQAANEVPQDIVYTTSSQTSFDNAFSIAKALDKDKSDAEKIKTVADSLQEAIKHLTENADTTKYYSVKDKALSITNQDYIYTSDSWEKYKPVYKVYSSLKPKDTPKEEQRKLDDAADNLAEAYTWLVKNADFTAMRAAIIDAGMQDEEDYTPATWEAQKKALDAANQFDQKNTPDLDQEEVNRATKALETATAKLVLKTDWEALQTALKNAAAVEAQEKAYTSNSWTPFKTALDTAKGIEETNTTTQAVADAAKALNGAQAALVKKADSTALNSAIAEADKLKEADYTSASWSAFAEALANAKAVDQNNATQTAVDAARDGLELAQSKLIEKTSFAGLNEAIQAAEALKETDYTKDSWKTADVAAALAEAKAIEQDPENTPQADVDAAVQKLTDAMEQLVKKGDPKALDEAIKTAEALKAEDYTASTWAALQAALTEANALDRGNADQAAVNTQTEKLVAAMDALVMAADKAALAEACAAAEAKDSGIYTQASYEPLQTALAEARKVLDNGDAAQQEVDKALEGLNKALAGLIKIEKAEAEGYQVTAEIPENAELSITKQDEQKAEAAQKNIRKDYKDAELLALFDINLGDYQLGKGESVKITIALPEAAWGYDSYKVYHEKEDGSFEYLDVVYDAESHTLTFTVSSFSDFGIVGFKNASDDKPDENSGSNNNGAGQNSSQNSSGTAKGSGASVGTGITADSPSAVLAAAALVAAAGLVAFVVYRRKTTK